MGLPGSHEDAMTKRAPMVAFAQVLDRSDKKFLQPRGVFADNGSSPRTDPSKTLVALLLISICSSSADVEAISDATKPVVISRSTPSIQS